jgi:RHS repeat-associated protein
MSSICARNDYSKFGCADQRYYASTYGRFNSADPYVASGGPASPASWNRYSYTRGDPINRLDPHGTCDQDSPGVVNVCDTDPGVDTVSMSDLCNNLAAAAQAGDPVAVGLFAQNCPAWVPSGGGAAAAGTGRPSFARDPNAAADNKVISSVFDSLKRLLDKVPNCENWLMGGVANGSITAFNQFYSLAEAGSGAAIINANGGTGISALTDISLADPGFSSPSYYPAITINPRGTFFVPGSPVGFASQYASQIGLIVGGSLQGQYFVLLHELAHYMGVPGFSQSDNTLAAQEANNDLVFKNCSQIFLRRFQ